MKIRHKQFIAVKNTIIFQIIRGTWDKVQSESKVLEEQVSNHWVSGLYKNVTETPTLSNARLQDKLLAASGNLDCGSGFLPSQNFQECFSTPKLFAKYVSPRFIWCLIDKNYVLKCTSWCFLMYTTMYFLLHTWFPLGVWNFGTWSPVTTCMTSAQ